MNEAFVEALMVPGDMSSVVDLLRPPEWIRRAACRGRHKNFVPSASATARWKQVPAELAAICGRCEVRGECLDMALADSSRTGCWGGLSDRQRNELRRQRKAA